MIFSTRYTLTAICLLSAFLLIAQSQKVIQLENNLSRAEKNSPEYVELLNALSFEYLKSNPAQGLDSINSAIAVAKAIGYQKGLFRALINKGSAFSIAGLSQEALAYYFEAQVNSVEESYADNAKLNNNIGELYKDVGVYDSAILYYEAAWNIVATHLPDRYPSILAANMGEMYLQLNHLDSAAKYYTKSYEFSKLDNNPRGMAYALSGLAQLSYTDGNIQRAIQQMQQASTIQMAIDDQLGLMQSYIHLSDYHFQKNERQSTENYLGLASQVADRLNDPQNKLIVLQKLTNVKRAYGDFKTASDLALLHQELSDSLNQKVIEYQISQARSIYTAEQHQQEVARLKEKEAEQTFYINVQIGAIIAISIIVLILLAFLYQYIKRLRQIKSHSHTLNEWNQIIAEKNEQIEKINKQLDWQLINTNKMLVESQNVSKIGSWQYDIVKEEVLWTKQTFRQLGVQDVSAKPSYSIIKDRLTPEDFHLLNSTIEEVINEKSAREITIGIYLKNQPRKDVFIKAIPEIEDDLVVRVYGTNRDITDQLATRKREQSIIESLLKISKMDVGKVSPSEQVEFLLELASQTLAAGRTCYWQFDESQTHMECIAQHRIQSSGYDNGAKLQKSDYPSYFKTLLNDRVISVSDTAKDTIMHEFKNHFETNGVKSMLDVLILSTEHQPVGVLCIEMTETKFEWSFMERSFATAVADAISAAQWQYQKLELENARDKLIQQLSQKNKRLKELASVISHNMRDRVAQILGLTQLYDNQASESLKLEITERVKFSTRKLDDVIRDLNLVLSHQQLEDLVISDINLRSLINKIAYDLQAEYGVGLSTTFNFDDSEVIQSHEPFIQSIFHHLIDNSIQYRTNDRDLVVEVTIEREETTLLVTYSDNGSGIDMERFGDKIFRMYQRFHLEKDGRGLGLYLSRVQVEALEGTIELNSVPGEGTTLYIRLPLSYTSQIVF